MDYKALAKIKRKSLSEYSLQGFILQESPDLLLFQCIEDFRPDGLRVVRKSDVSEVKQNSETKFYTERLKELGVYNQTAFTSYNITSWQTFFQTSQKDFRFYTIEEENKGWFTLGQLESIDSNEVVIKDFDSEAVWHEEQIKILYEDITIVHLGTYYANVYEDYIKKRETI